ncbi:P60 [Mulberry crinivirus]|nr:p59 protein [Mulberry crinivirus]WBP49978.1 P60 [Mulberry crinivirus]
MVRLLVSQNVRCFFQLMLKKIDVSSEIAALSKYLISNYSTENRNLYRTSARRGSITFVSNYRLVDSEIQLDEEDDVEIVKLGIIYFYRIRPELIKKTVYNPEALLASLDWKREFEKWKPYLNGDMTDYISKNGDVGCTYTEKDISDHYPNASAIRRLTLYRICNSLGKFVDLSELDKGQISAFDVKVAKGAKSIDQSLSTNKLFLECLKVFKDYVSLSSSKSGKAKLDANKLIYEIFMSCLLSRVDLTEIKNNPLALAKFMFEFDRLTVQSVGFKDNYDAIIKLFPGFKLFILKVFKVDTSLNEDKLFFTLPKVSVVEILGKPDIVGAQMAATPDFSTNSNVNTLPNDVDQFVNTRIKMFLMSVTDLPEKELTDSLLFILAKTTTTMKQLKLRQEVAMKFGGHEMKFILSDLTSYVLGPTYAKFPSFRGLNLIRMWANRRGDRALTLFRMRDFNPGLFSNVPKILPYMRFDFFKALSLKNMTDEEVESFRTLRLMTEKNSNNMLEDEVECNRWIFRS